MYIFCFLRFAHVLLFGLFSFLQNGFLTVTHPRRLSVPLSNHWGRVDRITCGFFRSEARVEVIIFYLSKKENFKYCLCDGDNFGGLPGLAWLLSHIFSVSYYYYFFELQFQKLLFYPPTSYVPLTFPLSYASGSYF